MSKRPAEPKGARRIARYYGSAPSGAYPIDARVIAAAPTKQRTLFERESTGVRKKPAESGW